jgi:hypothetical protein
VAGAVLTFIVGLIKNLMAGQPARGSCNFD